MVASPEADREFWLEVGRQLVRIANHVFTVGVSADQEAWLKTRRLLLEMTGRIETHCGLPSTGELRWGESKDEHYQKPRRVESVR